MSESASNLRLGRFVETSVAGKIVRAFVPRPPPPTERDGCLDALERFMHENGSRLSALIKADLLHVQFATIHPFLDGNGRIGRLLVTLYLCVNGVLRKPLLYLSLYLKTHRADYYRLLQKVRERITTESDRAGSALRIHDLFQQNPFLTANQIVQQTGLSAPPQTGACVQLPAISCHLERGNRPSPHCRLTEGSLCVSNL